MNGADSGVLEGFGTYNLSELQTRFHRFQCAGDIMLSRSSMDSILRGLSEEFAALNPPINPRFRPPASEQQIVAAERALQVAFPESLRALLSCHDGQEFYRPEIGYGDPVFPMMHQPATGQAYSHYWLGGIEDIINCTQAFREEHQWYSGEHFETFGPTGYHEHFLMFTNTENADCLALDLNPQRGGAIGQVVLFCTQVPQIIVLAPDLETLLTMLTADYRRGRFRHLSSEHFVSYAEFSP